MRKISILPMSLVLICMTVFAQNSDQADLFDIPLQDLKNVTVSSIDFSNRSLNDSFAGAYVITSQMIESLPMITFAEYLELLIPSTNIVAQGTNGAGPGIRGSAGGGGVRTLTMWDGHSQNRKDGNGNMGVYYSPLLNDIHQVEIILGPGSVKHGAGALDGYINFVPKSGQNFQGSKVDLDYGSNDSSQRLQFQHGRRFGNNRDFYVYAGVYHADGFRLSNDFGGSIAPAVNESRKFVNRGQIITGDYDPSYKLSTNWTYNRFNLKTLLEHVDFDPGGVIFGYNLLNQRTTLSIQPKYTYQLPGKSSFELASAATFYDKSRLQNPVNEDVSEFIESGGRESAFELRGTLHTQHFNSHELSLGAQVKWLDTTSRKHFFSTDPNSHRSFVDGNWLEYSTFFENIYTYSDKTTFIVGLRHDGAKFNNDFRFDADEFDVLHFRPDDISHFSPRLGMSYRFDNDFLFRAGYSEGFAYPDVSNYSRIFRVNQFLESRGLEPFETKKPESLESIELGLRGDLIKDELLFDISVYYNTYKDNDGFINFRNTPEFLPGNLSIEDIPSNIFGVSTSLDNDIDGYGAEISLSWKPDSRFFANVSYNYSTPDHVNAQDNESTGIVNEALSEWTRFPKHQLKSNINYKYNNWQFSLAAVFQSGLEISRRFTPTRTNGEDEYSRVNFGIKYFLNKKTSISFIAKNIFQSNTPRTTVDPSRSWAGGLGSDERLLYLGLRHSF